MTPELYEELILKYPSPEKRKLKIGNLELFMDVMHVENPEEIIRNSELIQGHPFAKLDYILKWKKVMGREKDLNDVRLIEKYIAEQ